MKITIRHLHKLQRILQPELIIQESQRSQTLNFKYLLGIYTWDSHWQLQQEIYKIKLKSFSQNQSHLHIHTFLLSKLSTMYYRN